MTRPESALLFAAGFGTRMAPLTQDRPKPLITVGGQPLIGHALDLLRAAGIGRIVANTHYRAGQLTPFLSGNRIVESHEPTILDTGGGLKQALPLLGGGPVITLNTDAVWTGPNPVTRLLQHWNPDRMDCLMMLIPRKAATGHAGPGDFLPGSDGRLTPGPGAVYSGLQIISPDPFSAETRSVFGMHDVWSAMIAKGRLYGIEHTGGWCDVGRPDAIPLAEALLRAADV